jgi:multisubunit Na+/H+ antiporter MnhG subunit
LCKFRFDNIPNIIFMKKILPLVWMLFILVELVINFLQYYFTPIDGDLVAIVLPADWYSQVLGDPTGLKTIQNGDLIGGAGRSMAHWTMYLYYHHVPQLLQYVVNPIESVYLASALFKMIAMVAFVTAFTLYNRVHTKTFGRVFLFTPILILPLIQYRGFYDVMRTVDQATTYVFFYLWPVALFMLFYYPIYRWVQAPKSERVSPTSCISIRAFCHLYRFRRAFDAAFVYIVWGCCYPNNMVEKIQVSMGSSSYSKLEKLS